ncbi:LysM peptidoglycan-binding domain-containing protein, partial [Aspergillus saccharolyticus JOP 1030-1]
SSTAAGTVTTPLPIQTGMVSDCDEFRLIVSGDTCATVASAVGICLADFYAWNPAVGDTGASLWVNDYVCVGIGMASNTPKRYGDDCYAFHWVVSGDDCADIASTAGSTLVEFNVWNPAVGDTCASLWVDKYVCMGTA